MELESFKGWLLQHERGLSTVHRHYANIRRLYDLISEFTKEEVDGCFVRLKEKGCKNTYINSLISTVRVYAQFKHLDKRLQKYRFLKEEVYVKATMSDEEITAFIELPRPHKKGARRSRYDLWTCFFYIMAFTGMRPGEVASLTVNDIDWGRNVIIVDDTKTHDFRYVPIAPNLAPILKEHIQKLSGEELFKGSDDTDWHYNFHTRLNRLGIKRTNLTPYSLRHSWITRMLEEDVNLFKVQKICGHKDLKTTAHYTHLTTKDIQTAIMKDRMVLLACDPKEIVKRFREIIEGLGFKNDKRFFYKIDESENGLSVVLYIK